ncbi:Ltp family lipoprotein [Corynebacterium spheniscorum]|uniref:Host cell surface-exposed lipoprotein n=1 Tax=Corynebacterium spheniscorum TaxID=185761 RepID=A0A1I2UKY5_9CORY|nr:Ltp family lipoprotein [Corynebacterium spheniscorum]KAA8720387.1 hypothetical protein F4V56_07755 [Corynebacterium spheniscorum]SFG75431.1 Host cell surface-exposed lipoprotein [Corynebacterium spheniscorum]
MSKRSDYERMWQELLSQRGVTRDRTGQTRRQEPQPHKDRAMWVIAGGLVVYLLLRGAYGQLGGLELHNPFELKAVDKPEEIEAPLLHEDTPEDLELAKVLVEERLEQHPWSRKSLMDTMCRLPGTAVLTCDEVDAALELMDVDWDENALKSAQRDVEFQYLSKSVLYEQLTHPYGAAFTPEQADYAMKHFYVDWRQIALKAAKQRREEADLTDEELFDYLSDPHLGGFTEEDARWALEQLNSPWS